MLAPSLDDVVFRMKVGDVSDVVRVKQGFVILKVTERLAANSPAPKAESGASDPKPSAQLEVPTKPNPFRLSGTTTPSSAIQQAAIDAASKRGGGGQVDEFGLGTGAHGRVLGGLEILSDTQGVDFGPYFTRILQDVKKNWYSLIQESDQMKSGKLAIEFAITKERKIAGMKLVDSSGDVSLDRAAWGGITASNPFPPLPSDFGGQYVALRFRFSYNPAPGALSQVSPEVSHPTGAQPHHSQAVPSLGASTSAASADSRDPLGEANVLFRKGHFDGALQKYQELLQGQPKSPEAYAGMIRVYLKMKNAQRAYDTATKGLEVADAAPLRVALGEVYFRQGKIHEAEQEWINVIKSGHQDARAYLGLARVRWALSMYKSGRGMIDKARELDTTDPDIQKLWVSGLSRAEHIKSLEKYLASQTNDDADTISATRHYLEYLKALDKQPKRNCRLVGNATATDAELVQLLTDAVHLRGYGLSVAVNGAKSKLLLDTGSSGILINRRLAEKASLTRLADTDIRGVGDKGNQGGYTAVANSLKIGQLEFQDCPVRVLEQRSVVDEDGLIGADVFSHFLVEIDFPNEKLRLTELPKRPDETAKTITLQTDTDEPETNEEENDNQPALSRSQDRYIAPEMKSYSQVYRFGHALLVPTRIGDAPSKLFLLDTGAFSNLITPAAASEVTKVHGDSRTVVKGISGTVKDVYRADKAVILFGHLRQENQDLPAFDLKSTSDEINTEVSGILGFRMLHLLDIRLDYRDGLVDFEYKSHR
jgi:TonB family protein